MTLRVTLVSVGLLLSPSIVKACQPLAPELGEKLSAYMKEALRLSSDLHLLSASPVGDTCYQKLTFTTSGSKRSQIIAFLSPDQRFLLRELIDTRIDLVAVHEREAAELRQGLANGDFPSKGPSDSLVTLTVFEDFECTFCKQQMESIDSDKELREHIRIVFRNLPLSSHPWARRAAEIGRCVYMQSNDAFWVLHNSLFRQQDTITLDNLDDIASRSLRGRSDLNIETLDRCIAGRKSSPEVEEDMRFAETHRIRATPTLFVNDIRRDGLIRTEDLRELVRAVSAKAQ
jgi:protein-disulfide isomerase